MFEGYQGNRRKQEAELARKKALESSASSKAYMDILDIQFANNKKIYVSLELDNDNIAHVKEFLTYKPDNSLYLQGTLQKCNTTIPLLKMGQCISYGIESYYVKEHAGKALENNLRNGALVRVSVDKNGKAKVKGFQE